MQRVSGVKGSRGTFHTARLHIPFAVGSPALNMCTLHLPSSSILAQGDFVDPAVELILKQFKSVKKSDLALVENKKKSPYFDEEDDEDEDELFD